MNDPTKNCLLGRCHFSCEGYVTVCPYNDLEPVLEVVKSDHEPECDDYQNDNSDGFCICLRLKDAYKRGRDDAANQLQASIRGHWWLWERFDRLSFLQWKNHAIAAARGGEQE